MKQYVIDELRPGDVVTLRQRLAAALEPSGVKDVYWKILPPELLNGTQRRHTQCAPFYVALTLSSDSLCCEFLVRTNIKIHCDCMAYMTPAQRNWLVHWVDEQLMALGIVV